MVHMRSPPLFSYLTQILCLSSSMPVCFFSFNITYHIATAGQFI